MIRIKVTVSGKKIPFSIPVPYLLLRAATSSLVLRPVLKLVDNQHRTTLAGLDPTVFKELVRTLQHFKGTELVHIDSHDGTKVIITL
ncbi:hypothetical protein [Bacillus sp. 165]|uniref:hypothetical protein n=1 Tax=Bacillus sp. 165 TaxID=1529117 RepID=UPI001ADAD084|nr:hypothetical protein [Bacillus sp. 165]MBO9130375.1 hypothetical protein [Bacillus sp. 165]